MTYIMSVFMAPSGIFVSGPVLITALLILATEFNAMLVKNPALPVLSISYIANGLKKAASSEIQWQGRHMRSDMEVYCGFFLITMVFTGAGSFFAVITFWQMMRVRYMINPQIQSSF